MTSAFARHVADHLRTERFRLLDIGCSGGIDPLWRSLGGALEALGVDPSVAECRRLAASEANPDVRYVPAFVAGSSSRRIDLSAGPAAPLIMQMRDRLSFMRTRELRDARLKAASTAEKLRHNAWELTDLADTEHPRSIADLLADRHWSGLDYLKIDVDGADFEILKSLQGRFDDLRVIAVQMEVNFVGTDDPTDHTFHNTDRFLRSQGFDLFRLDVRNFSSRALPARYVWPTPAETISGRPFQGEAYYARDILAQHRAGTEALLSREKIAKLALVMAAWDVPDAAAELLQARRDQLAPIFDVSVGLDLLAAQAQGGQSRPLSYRGYMARFEADVPDFYRPEGPIPLKERLRSAWRGYWHPRERRL